MLAIACGSSTKPLEITNTADRPAKAPAPAPVVRKKLEVLGFEVVPPGPAPALVPMIDLLTAELRSAAGEYAKVELGSGRVELVDALVLMNCQSSQIACMVAIGKSIGADWIVYGSVSQTSPHPVALELLDVTSEKLIQTSIVSLPVDGPSRRAAARMTMAFLLDYAR